MTMVAWSVAGANDSLRATTRSGRRQGLRDKFAMAAMPSVIGTEAPHQHFTDEAYRWADLMLVSRTLPESR
jgi:hypothetical protein